MLVVRAIGRLLRLKLADSAQAQASSEADRPLCSCAYLQYIAQSILDIRSKHVGRLWAQLREPDRLCYGRDQRWRDMPVHGATRAH